MKKSHRKSTLILETTDNGIIAIQKSSQKITTFNRTCEQLFGLRKEKVIGLPLEEAQEESQVLQSFIASAGLKDVWHKEITKNHFQFSCPFHGKDREFLASVMLLPKLSNEDEAEDILLIFNDITEKQEMERELLHSEKLQLVGQLAAGFAHEIRNPLTTIRGFLHLYESSDSPPQAYNQLMIKEIDRVNSIIEELLHLASPKAFDKVNTNITRLLNEIHLFYQSEAKAKKIDFQTNVEPLPNVYLDPDKLHQVLLNLVKNGLEAIGTDGRLTISARAEMGRNKIVIEVIDSGNGMDKQTIEKKLVHRFIRQRKQEPDSD